VKIEDEVVGDANAVFLLKNSKDSSFITNADYSLYKSTLLDSGTSIHIVNDLSRFYNFKKAPRNHVIRCGNHFARILGYGTVNVDVKNGNKQGILRLKNVAYCPDFMTSLVSFTKLKERGIYWDTENNQLYRIADRSIICTLQEIDGQQVINFRPVARQFEAFAANRIPRRRKVTTRDPRPPRKGDGMLWHQRLGHPGPMAIHKLGQNSLGVKLTGPSIVQCPHCSLAKIRKQISRRPPLRDRSTPGIEIHIDWTDLENSFDGFVRTMFFTDAASGFVTPYYMTTYGTERENLAALKDYVEHLEGHNIKVKTVRSDNELFTKKTCAWLRKKTIKAEPSAPRTQDQNGLAERSGGVVITKARAMRIGANLPHNLWKETVNTAAYLHNRTPRENLEWKTPYEVFYTHVAKLSGLNETRKPQLAHLRAYGCRAYAMTKDAQLKQNRLRKLDPRAHIGYLVGYNSTNIFRIWIPHQGKVISTRDVIFDEETFFDKKDLSSDKELIDRVDELVARVSLEPPQAKNEEVLEEDGEILYPERTWESDESNDDEDEVQLFDEKDDYELARAVEEGLITPPPSEVDYENGSANVAYIPFQVVERAGTSQGTSNHRNEDNQGGLSGLQEDSWNERLEAFQRVRIGSAFHGIFEGHRMTRIHKRNLPPAPKRVKDLLTHPFRKEFEAAQHEHLKSHDKMESFEEVDRYKAKGHQVLGCMWVFVYKTDKHGFLQKCKARIVVWGHQQAQNGLPTRATTLASTTFRTLMAITAKFDLETQQMDAVNAFVHCDLDETVFMKCPPGFEKPNKVLRLRKALYGLRRSPLLWQKELTKTLTGLGFRAVPQEPRSPASC
jgi:Reverse transcriptase (RNA-dependent DNA polymerase)/GAG-pre-integrase domain